MEYEKKAIFIDKDGTLVDDVPYNVDPARIRLKDGASAALRRLHESGYLLVLVSNQSGVARGFFPEYALLSVFREIQNLLRADGARLDAFYYCPHFPQGNVDPYARVCDCRKPNDGMLRRAMCDLGIKRRGSWMVGDIADDVEAGNRAGLSTILLGTEKEEEGLRKPAHRATTFFEIYEIVRSYERGRAHVP